MKSLAWLVLLFAAAVALAVAAAHPGYVLLAYPPWRIELSFSLFVLGALGTFILGHLLLRGLTSVLQLPAHVRRYRAGRKQEKGRAAMLTALTAYFEGRFAAAEKMAQRAIALGEQPALNAVLAARAAHALRQFELRDAYLSQAAGKTAGEDTLRLLAQAEFELERHQPQAALAALKTLDDSGMHKHVGAMTLELKAQQQAHNWDAVLELAGQLEKRNAIHRTMAQQMRQHAWLEKLRASAENGQALRTLWKQMPPELRRTAGITAAAARIFMQAGECALARQILTESLNAEWNSELVALYGDCREGSVVGQIEQAEAWLAVHHDDAGLLLALGKLCLHQELWGKAQNYLEASLSVQPGRATYTALAQLAEKQHKPDEAFRYYQLATKAGEVTASART
ncbi:MAG: heme biosynthesis protein HemY [Sideroxydans sp.]